MGEAMVSRNIRPKSTHAISAWPPCFAARACLCLQVFTTAASDESPQIVRLAFDTVEKIVREHFHYITGEVRRQLAWRWLA